MERQTQVVEEKNRPNEKAAEPRRSLLQIRMDILKAVANGSGKPTQIMYTANLSWALLKSQISSFLELGLLSVQKYGSRKRYELTAKGAEILEAYEKIEKDLL